MFDLKAPLDRAKEAANGATGLAHALGGITPQAVSQWDHVPHKRVRDVSRVTGIPCHELRPDLYDPPVADGQGAPNAAA